MRFPLFCLAIVHLYFLLFASGCAFGHKYPYDQASPNIEASGGIRIAVATYDQRPYILDESEKPEFVGLTRAGFGNPYGVRTTSELPLAEDMTKVICKALSGKGYSCVPIDTSPNLAADELQRKIQGAGGNRAILLVLKEWKSDTHIDTTLAFDTTLRVLDESGGLLAETNIHGKDTLGSNFFDPIGLAHQEVPKAYQRKLEELLNNPSISAALQKK